MGTTAGQVGGGESSGELRTPAHVLFLSHSLGTDILRPKRITYVSLRLPPPLAWSRPSSVISLTVPFSLRSETPCKCPCCETRPHKGITDFPVTRTYLDELLSDWGDYVDVDGIKFAGRSFSFMPEKRLRDLIEVVHKHGARDLVHCPRVFRLRLLCEHWGLHRASLGCLRWKQGRYHQLPSQVQESWL